MLKEIWKTICKCKEEGTRIMFLDEAIFSHTTGPSRAWAHKNDKIDIDESLFNMRTRALIMAVSIDKGVDSYRIHLRSIKNEEFIAFLKILRQ
jgi:hypothetical protein